MSKHTTLRLEAIGNLVRTGLEHGGMLVADCRDSNGNAHSDEAKANAALFVVANDLLEALQLAKNSLVAFKFMPGPCNAWEEGDEASLLAIDAAIAKALGAST